MTSIRCVLSHTQVARRGGKPLAGTIGAMAVIVCPVVYGIIGGIAAVIPAIIYNLAARWVRGVEVEIH